MLKKTSLSVCLVLLTACHQNNSRLSVGSGSDVIARYQQFITTLDTADVKAVSLAAAQYRKLFYKAGKDTCDEAFVIFEACWKKMAQKLTGFIKKDSAVYAPLVAIDEYGTQVEATGKLLQFNGDMHENGYRVVLGKGGIMVVPDWNYAAARFSRFVTAEMTEYLNHLGGETKSGYRQSAWVKAAPEETIENMVWRESFNSRYAGFILHNNIKEEQRSQLSDFIAGRSDSAWFRAACLYLETKHAGTATHKIISPYYKAWVANDDNMKLALLDRYFKQGYINSVSL